MNEIVIVRHNEVGGVTEERITFDVLMDKVQQMRHAQRRYFRFRDPEVLAESKALEKEIDEIIAARREIQQKLFYFVENQK